MNDKRISKNRIQRESNIELLRIVSMFLVLIVHTGYVSIGMPSFNLIAQDPIYAIIRFLLQSISIICVNVFVMISGWFGIHPKSRSIANFLFQFLFFAFGIYGTMLLIGGAEFSLVGVRQLFFMTNEYWFIKAYLLLVILSPALNALVEHVSRGILKNVVICFFVFSCIYDWMTQAVDYFNFGYSPLSFCGLYLAVRYIKVYKPRWAGYRRRVDMCVFSAMILVATILGFLPYFINQEVTAVSEQFADKYFVRLYAYNAPWVIVSSFAFFLFFAKANIGRIGLVNWISNSAFAVYLFHVNPNVFPHYTGVIQRWNQELGIVEFYLSELLFLLSVFVIAVVIDQFRIILWKVIEQYFRDQSREHSA